MEYERQNEPARMLDDVANLHMTYLLFICKILTVICIGEGLSTVFAHKSPHFISFYYFPYKNPFYFFERHLYHRNEKLPIK